jgi:Tol biopolymer transport system component
MITMKRMIALAVVVGALAAVGLAQAREVVSNGRIVFRRPNAAIGDTAIYSVRPDGSHLKLLFPGGSEEPAHWSPDGRHVAIDSQFACPNAGFNCDAAVIVDANTGSFRELKNPRPKVLDDFFCTLWSPNGKRLACLGTSNTKQSANGIYTIRSSDGGGLTRVTAHVPPGGADRPSDYSPNGKRLVFTRTDANDQASLFVVNLNGRGLRQIQLPPRMELFTVDGSWSPQETEILISARSDPDHRSSIWVIRPNGTGLHQVAIPKCGGAFADPAPIGCTEADWSPDGRKIAFIRIDVFGHQNVYTARANGSGLHRVTHGGPGLEDEVPDWGPRARLG